MVRQEMLQCLKANLEVAKVESDKNEDTNPGDATLPSNQDRPTNFDEWSVEHYGYGYYDAEDWMMGTQKIKILYVYNYCTKCLSYSCYMPFPPV